MLEGSLALAIVTSISSVPVCVTLTTSPVRSEIALRLSPDPDHFPDVRRLFRRYISGVGSLGMCLSSISNLVRIMAQESWGAFEAAGAAPGGQGSSRR